MSTPGGTRPEPLSFEALERMDAICTDFEKLWRAGQPARLEDFLARGRPEFRAALFEELLHLELDYRRKRGEAMESEEYRSRFPDETALVDRVWEDFRAGRAATLAPADAADVRERQLKLTVIAGPYKGQVFHVREHAPFLVGRSRRAHFRVRSRDEFISRVHFKIEVNPPHCTLLDMGSTNGTYVNEERVDSADLKDGDLIRAGQTVMRVSLST
jgi:hypothetical protein